MGARKSLVKTKLKRINVISSSCYWFWKPQKLNNQMSKFHKLIPVKSIKPKKSPAANSMLKNPHTKEASSNKYIKSTK